jgi:hypothetical protein
VKIKNKIKVLNVAILKHFNSDNTRNSENTDFEELNFNHSQNRPITRVDTKLIHYKNAAQLTLSILQEEEDTNISLMCAI